MLVPLLLVTLRGFEPRSRSPKTRVIGRYTTGVVWYGSLVYQYHLMF